MNPDLSIINKILIIQYQPFGDVFLNTGYLPALRRKFPSAQIDFLVRKPYHTVLLKNPNINNLITFQNGEGFSYLLKRLQLVKKIRSLKYNLIIDQIRNAGSAQITLFSGAEYKLGFDHQRWSSIYNLKAKRKEIRYYSAMKFDLLEPLGIIEEPHSLFLHIENNSIKYIDDWLEENNLLKQKIVCLSPGSPVKPKQWPAKSFALVADRIVDEVGLNVILLWGPREKTDAEEVQRLMKKKAILAPSTTFNQVAAMLKKGSLLICNDGGINHLAVATETPTIAIFGKHKPKRWSPASIFKTHHHLYNSNVDYKTDKTFGISVNEVFEMAKEVLNES